MKRINLYSKDKEGNIYLPNWLFSHKLEAKKKLSTPFIYKGTFSDEQVSIMKAVGDSRTGLIEMKTGRGKTHSLFWLIQKFQEPTLIAVHNIGTLVDMQEKFEKFTNTIPWVWYGKKKKIGEITITTHDSFVANIDEFKGKFWIIINDECDFDFTEKMIKALIFTDGDGLFGLTGTPKTKELNTSDMELVYGKHIKVEDQEINWYNMIPEIVRLEYMTDRFFSFENRHDLRQQLIDDVPRLQKQMNFIIKQREDKTFKYWLLLVERKEEECVKYHSIINKLWLPCVIINGDTKVEDDQKNIEIIKETWGIIVWTVGKLWRGKDIPFIDWVFLFFPNRFESSTIQAVWRWLREAEGKSKVMLFDRCDMPILNAQAKQRILTYKQEYTEDVKITKQVFLDFKDKD